MVLILDLLALGERTTSPVAAMSAATRLVLLLPVLAFFYRFWALDFSITGWTENDIPDLAGKVRFPCTSPTPHPHGDCSN